MWLCVQPFLPVHLFAQNEAQLGKWERLYYNNQVVRWRDNASQPFDWDQQIRDENNVVWSRDYAWQDIYGIHAALLPVSGETGALQRGWVILWGYNDLRADSSSFLVSAPEAEPCYFAAISDYLVSRLGTTSVLLWHPEEGETQAAKFGYVRYLFDTHPWNNPGEYPPYNLFCSGHLLLPDGRLFAAGGNGGLYGQVGNCVGSYIGLRLWTIFEAQNFRRSETAFRQHLWWTFFPLVPRVCDAPEPRWYPSVVALPDGKVLIVGGTQYGFRNAAQDLVCDTPLQLTQYHEIFDPCTRAVTRSTTAIEYSGLQENYPRLHLVSFVQDGQLKARVVYTGPRTETYFLENPSLPSSNWDAYRIDPTDPRSDFIRRAVHRGDGTSVLLPNPVENPKRWQDQVLSRVLTIGGSGDTSALSFDLNDFANGQLTIRHAQLPDYFPARKHLNAVLLPTGQVLVVGGNKPDPWNYPNNVVWQTLLYTPPSENTALGRWEVVASAPDTDEDNDGIKDGTRVYHSTALLLPDGRVLTAGSATKDSAGRVVDNYVPTLYSPPYLFKSDGTRRGDTDRPRILSFSHTELNYGQDFAITYQLAGDSQGIRSVVLMRSGSVTHSFNFEQRLVRLRFLLTYPDSGSLVATAPWDPAIAPPGWYMLFLVDGNGVPSKAAWVQLKAPACSVVAEPATLTVELEGVQGISAEQAEAIESEPMTLEFRNAATGTTIASYTLPMMRPDEQGRVMLRLWSDLPAGVYELYVPPYRSWLGRRVRLSWQPGGRYSLVLRNGDVVKDNAVDVVDLVAVLERQGATGLSEADVTCDGVVNEEDAALVATNVGTQGDG